MARQRRAEADRWRDSGRLAGIGDVTHHVDLEAQWSAAMMQPFGLDSAGNGACGCGESFTV